MPTTSASSRGLQVAALQKEMEEVAAAKVATKAEAAAAAEDWSGRRVRLQADFDNLRARNANQTLEAHTAHCNNHQGGSGLPIRTG
jgi:molecular chaperone GrpE (heat shock protein)